MDKPERILIAVMKIGKLFSMASRLFTKVTFQSAGRSKLEEKPPEL
ncbi:unannotated protein [freshwater metagenome]|uniref:Unannotated protein n=1 Tax=freshwater metagenome TaxID=449393 RepID=A0A6J6H7T8_9ZZZZ